jgi:hypothetical protein
MIRRWVGCLLALFALLWAKLPGLSTQEEPQPSSEFRFKRKGESIEISTEAANLSWLSEQIGGITMQEVERRPDGSVAPAGDPLRSLVEVKMTSPGIAELRGLTLKAEERLLSGTGHYTIVTGIVKEGRFHKQRDMLVKGKGRGTWEILKEK